MSSDEVAGDALGVDDGADAADQAGQTGRAGMPMIEDDWWAMSAWAETIEIDPTKPGVLHGTAAAAHGRAALRAALADDPG